MTDTDQHTDAAAVKARQEADKKRQDEVRKKVKEDREARDKAAKDVGTGEVKPTPTQEENDLAASGVHVLDHEPDGSPEQAPGIDQHQTRHAVADKPAPKAGYQTRQSNPTG